MKNILLMAIIGLLGTGISVAQIAKVDQEVYGMDCAPCAYGLERGLKKMEGIQKIRVSLNDGKAYLGMTADSEVTLRDIQEEVKKNGFSAKKADITLSGSAKMQDGQWVIETGQEQFEVSEHTTAELVKNLSIGTATVMGTVQDEEDGNLSGRWSIVLSKIE